MDESEEEELSDEEIEQQMQMLCEKVGRQDQAMQSLLCCCHVVISGKEVPQVHTEGTQILQPLHETVLLVYV
jgi:hypothetical protein